MSDRELIRRALFDAIDWQESLADAQTDEWREAAKAQAKKYRALLKKRYGTTMTPMEDALKDAKTVTLDELRRRHEGKK